MLKQINRQKCLELYLRFAHFEDGDIYDDDGNFFYPEVFSSYNLSHKSKTFKAHVNMAASEITHLLKRLGFTSLLFLPNSDTPWLKYLDHNEHSIAASLFFFEHNISRNFSGALILNEKMFPVFLKHLFWMMRCNDAYPLVHFTDKRQQFMACICSYGSLHFDVLNPELDGAFRQKLAAGKLEMIGLDSCAMYADYEMGAKMLWKRKRAQPHK